MKQRAPVLYNERPSVGEYLTCLAVYGAGLGAFMLGSTIENDTSQPAFLRYSEAALLGAISAPLIGIGAGRGLEKAQHYLLTELNGLGPSPMSRVNYGYLNAQFIHESQLTEETLRPVAQRVYLIPEATVAEASGQKTGQ